MSNTLRPRSRKVETAALYVDRCLGIKYLVSSIEYRVSIVDCQVNTDTMKIYPYSLYQYDYEIKNRYDCNRCDVSMYPTNEYIYLWYIVAKRKETDI